MQYQSFPHFECHNDRERRHNSVVDDFWIRNRFTVEQRCPRTFLKISRFLEFQATKIPTDRISQLTRSKIPSKSRKILGISNCRNPKLLGNIPKSRDTAVKQCERHGNHRLQQTGCSNSTVDDQRWFKGFARSHDLSLVVLSFAPSRHKPTRRTRPEPISGDSLTDSLRWVVRTCAAVIECS